MTMFYIGFTDNTSLECDECETDFMDTEGHREFTGIGELLRAAEDKGWFITDTEDYCPKCRKDGV